MVVLGLFRFQPSSVSRFPIPCLSSCIPCLPIPFVHTGVTRVSRVHDASFVTCHSLRTPPALNRLTKTPVSFRFHARYNAHQSGTTFRSDNNSKGLRPQTAYNIPCVRFTSLVRLWPQILLSNHRSARGATLGNGGWLTLTMPGLSPGKMRHALRGALTTEVKGLMDKL